MGPHHHGGGLCRVPSATSTSGEIPYHLPMTGPVPATSAMFVVFNASQSTAEGGSEWVLGPLVDAAADWPYYGRIRIPAGRAPMGSDGTVMSIGMSSGHSGTSSGGKVR